jgi:hypothetical protein
MAKTKTTTAHILTGLFVFLAACQTRAAQELDLGSVTNSVYRNGYFGLTIRIPLGWHIVDAKAQRIQIKAGLSNVAADEDNLKSMVKIADLQIVSLVAALKYPLGTPTNNPSIAVAAEKVRSTRSGREYLLNTKQLLQSGRVPVAFPREIYSEKLGNVAFDVLDISRPVDLKLLQRQYARVMKGYALDIAVSFDSNEEEQVVMAALKSMRFDSGVVPKRP